MSQNDVPVNEETFDILSFLSGQGMWLLLGLALIAVVIYKKFKD